MASTSFNSYSSFIPNYQQAPWLMQLSQIEAQQGLQTYDWANQQIAQNGALTNNAINSYLSNSAAAQGLAGNQIDRYTGLFQPQENNLVQDANDYASTARIASEMGAAESGQGQAADANRQAAERELQSYGIDPSSGRYQELEAANRAGRGAAQAGAGWNARQQTEATGRALRDKAIAVGEQYPAAAVNSLNAAYNGLAGATNAAYANTNTGANALNAGNAAMKTASTLQYPPLGNSGTSSSMSGGNTDGGTSASRASSPSGPGGPSSNGGGGGNGGYGSLGPAVIGGLPNGGTPGTVQPGDATDPYNGNGSWMDPNSGTDFGGLSDPLYNMQAPTDQYWGSGGVSDPTATGNYWDGQGYQATPDQAAGFGAMDQYQPNTDWSGLNASTNNDFTAGMQGNNYDLGAANAGFSGNWGNASGTGDASGGWGSTPGAGDYPDMGNTPSYDQSYSGDSSGGDTSGMDGGGFARGGAIPDNATTGGFVSHHLSPSGGRNTDDIPARLNADEFVIPKDVAMWKGQEFFQKLIDQSRKARTTAPAKPDFSPPPPPAGPPKANGQPGFYRGGNVGCYDAGGAIPDAPAPMSGQWPNMQDQHAAEMNRINVDAMRRAQAAATARSRGTAGYAAGGAVRRVPSYNPVASASTIQYRRGGSVR